VISQPGTDSRLAVLQVGAVRGERVITKGGCAVKLSRGLIIALLVGCPSVRATSIVVLASKTEIGVAADRKVTKPNGTTLPDVCKIMHHGDFFFALSGTVSRGKIDDTRYNAMDIVIRASEGLKDINAIDERFDHLIAAPLQEVVEDDFERFPDSFREKRRLKEPPALEMLIFRITPTGPEMVESVFPMTFLKASVKIGRPYHHYCKAGQGECQLTVGTQDGLKEYLDDHPFTSDVAADAQRLVEFEKRRRPREVGGKITVLLIDSSGVHRADTSDKCPVEWRSRPPTAH
jgi:hypothetical protein